VEPKAWVTLPVDAFHNEITSKVETHDVVLISGETGCGKTSRVPMMLLRQFPGAKIVCTQIRKLATRSCAEHVAAENRCNFGRGEQVGYQTSEDHFLPARTGSVSFLTAGLLMNQLHELDATHVVVDEVHARGVGTDMLIACLRKRCLKLILMSATMNEDVAKSFPGAATVHIPGRTFPIEDFSVEDTALWPGQPCPTHDRQADP
jgi:HrpA-like RNA helicase